jgi:hypothetical protein
MGFHARKGLARWTNLIAPGARFQREMPKSLIGLELKIRCDLDRMPPAARVLLVGILRERYGDGLR